MQRPWVQKAMMRTAPAPMAKPDTPATIALSLTPVAVVAALLACDPLAAPIAILTGIALAVGLTAAFTRRWTAMAIAAGVAGGLSPAGLILAPLAIGLSIRVRSVRLPVLGIGVGAVVATTVGWRATASPPSLPSLLDVAIAHPGVAGLVVATGAGLAGWVAATATRPGTLAAGGVAGTLALAAFAPMPPVTLALAAMAIMTCYRRPPRQTPAANDNSLMRPAMRRQYRPMPARVTNNPLVPQNHAR